LLLVVLLVGAYRTIRLASAIEMMSSSEAHSKGLNNLTDNENPTEQSYDPQSGLNHGVQLIRALDLNI
jgi:hypothetical protein